MGSGGADMLGGGGESTRPGHLPIIAAEEVSRTKGVVERLARETEVPISIDTYKVEVAEAAISAGATILNDIWGLTRSPALAELASRAGSALVLMHNQDGTDYAGDLMEEIKRFLRVSIGRALQAGVPRERVLIDPGIGFGKTAEQNWVVMRRLEELRELGQPILIGTSRKSFIGQALGLPVGELGEGAEIQRGGGTRLIAVELLLFGDEQRNQRALVMPHPRIGEGVFVRKSLAEMGV